MKRDLRKYAGQTNFRLFVGAVFLLFVVGVGLIYVIYGSGAAVLGLLCLLGALLPVGLIYLALVFLDWLRKRLDRG